MNDIYTLAKSVAASKEDIRQAIINKKVNVDESEPLSAYAGKISEIRLASDYSDIVSVDAINYTGQDIKKGDKVWIVPNDISESSKSFTTYSQYPYNIVSRDGKQICCYNRIYNTENNSYIEGFPNISGSMHLRWDYDDIIGGNPYNRSIFLKRGVYRNYFLCHDFNYTYSSRTVTLYNKKLNKQINITIDKNPSGTGAYDDTRDIFSILSTGGYSSYYNSYKIDWENLTTSSLNSSPSNYFLDYTSDCKYLITTGNYIYKCSDTGFTTDFDYNKLNEDFGLIFRNTNVDMNYNRIDDILYVLDKNRKLMLAYKYSTNTEKFTLINSVSYTNPTSYECPYVNGSGDGKILAFYDTYFKVENNTKQYKATNTLTMTNTENALSGIAEENATNNQSFKVGVALGPLTQLTVTSNTENAEITVE